MMEITTAKQFAQSWEQAWNAHDIDRIMPHYADDIVLISPIAAKLLGQAEVKGAKAVRRYFLKGLDAYPDLRFTVLQVFAGEQSLVLYYVNQNGIKAGEFMQFDATGKVEKMVAHYSEP